MTLLRDDSPVMVGSMFSEPTVQQTVMPEPENRASFLDMAATAARMVNPLAADPIVDDFSRSMGILLDNKDPGRYEPKKPQPVAGYRPLADPQIESMDPQDWRFLYGSRSPEETTQLMRGVARGNRDNQTIADYGGVGVASVAALGFADPILLGLMVLPVAGPANWSRLARVGSVMGTTLIGDVASEAALHQQNVTRTASESAWNVGIDLALTAAIGTWATRMTQAERAALRAKTLSGTPTPEALSATPEALPAGADSAGAAARNEGLTLEGEAPAGRLAKIIAATVGRISATNRLLFSPALETRLLTSELGEVSYLQEKNLGPDGKPTVESLESLIDREKRRRALEYHQNFSLAYSQYAERVGKEAVTEVEFSNALSLAGHNGDVSDILEVSALSRHLRKQFDADRRALQESGEDLADTPMGAESYWPVVWDTNEILNNPAAHAAKLAEEFTNNPRPVNETPDVKKARTAVGLAADAQDTAAILEGKKAIHEEAKQAYAGAVVAEREALAKVTSEDTPEANRARFVHRQLSEETRLAKEDMDAAAEDMQGANDMQFPAEAGAARERDSKRKLARESAKQVSAVRRDLEEAKRKLARAERESAEATKEGNNANRVRERVPLNDASVQDKTRVHVEAKAKAKEAGAAIDANRAAAREKAALLRRAARDVEALDRKLTDLEAQKGYLDEEAAGSTPKQLEAAHRKLDRDIERTRERGIKAADKREALRQEDAAAHQELSRLRAAAREAEAEARAAAQDLKEATDAAKADARVAGSTDRVKARKAAAEAEANKLAQRVDDAKDILDESRKASREAIKAAREARKALDAMRQAARTVRKFEAEKLKAATEFRDPEAIKQAVRDHRDNILGLNRSTSDLGHVSGARPLKSRSLNVQYKNMTDFLVMDSHEVYAGYTNSMVPALMLRQRFGSTDLAEEFAKIERRYQKLKEGKTDAEVRKLDDRQTLDRELLEGMIRRLKGQAGPSPRSTWATNLVRAARITRQYNYIRALGGQTLSSLSDLGHLVSRFGLIKTGKALAKFVADPSFNKISRTESKRMGAALQFQLDLMPNRFSDISEDLVSGRGKLASVERAGQKMSQQFTKITLQATWNNVMENLTAIMEQDAIIRGAMDPSKLSPYKLAVLRNAGFHDDDLKVLAEQAAKYGDDSEGFWRGRTDLWDNKEIGRKLEAAVVRAGKVMTISRGIGDMPLLMDNEAMKQLLQFKTFGMVSVNRLMIPLAQGLSHGDLAAANGLAVMLALGTMTYAAKQKAAGMEIDTSPTRLASEALQWSGALAYLPDIWDPATGVMPEPLRGARFSRFKDNSPMSTLLGPTMGMATEAYGALSDATGPDGIKATNVHQARKLVPLQNLFWWRRIVNAVEGEVSEAVGAEGATTQSFGERVLETKPAK